MATQRKSLVYLDDVVQRALKDVLIPILGFRDTSKDLGQYTDEIEYLRKDVSALQVKDKGKIYIQTDVSQPINISLPRNSYKYDTQMAIEDIKVYVEFKLISDPIKGSGSVLAAEIVIPGGIINDRDIESYCSFCNEEAYRILKNAYVKIISNPDKSPSTVAQLYFPQVNIDNKNLYSRAIVTVYSQHRDVEKVDSWDGVIGNEENSSILSEHEVTLGAVPYFSDVPDKDKLVRSNTVEHVEFVTAPTMNYLSEAKVTDPTTGYWECESESDNIGGTLRFTDANQVQSRKDILLDVFGTDWSNVDVVFDDRLEDISGAFQGIGLTVAPRSISGKSVKRADSLFKDTRITHIPNQDLLLKGMPLLENINRLFENAPLRDALEETLLDSNLRLRTMHYAFRNTQISNTYEFWNMTHTYVPERDASISSLLSNPTEVTIRMDGIGCFEGVTTLPTSLVIPEAWKSDVKTREFLSVDEFLVKRNDILSQYNYDLSEITIKISEENASLAGLFAETALRKTPKSIEAVGATSVDRMFFGCVNLVTVLSSSIAKLTGVTSASSFLSNCSSLTTLPQDIFEPLKQCADYSDALSGLINMTGPTPTVGGHQLWELAGQEGYPVDITGYGCFSGSSFDNIADVPSAWGGTGA